MNILKQIKKIEWITIFIIIMLVDIFYLNTINFNIDLNSIDYSEKVSYLYFTVIKSNIFFVLIIPLFLYMSRIIYYYMYDYIIILKYKNLYQWWNNIIVNTMKFTIAFTILRNIIAIFLVIYEYGFHLERQIDILIYLVISIILQTMVLFTISMLMNIIVFIIRKTYVSMSILIMGIISYDFIMSSLRLVNFKLGNFIFITLEKTYMGYARTFFTIGLLILINLLIYLVGEKLITSLNLYRRSEEK
ncbi:MAG: hypothetical protein ACRC7N_16560 [Clostridium sp.]